MRGSQTISVLGLLLAVAICVSCSSDSLPSVTVYKTPACGCCTKWVAHLREAGLEVTTVEVSDMQQIKNRNAVPRSLSSCHTALVGGYVVEGHVPAEDILRLLSERPQIAGLLVPGMPIGSQGMEGPNPEPYEVFAFDKNGQTRHFASHGS